MRTGAILKQQAWVWPIIAVVVLSAVGYSVSTAIRTTMKSSFQSQLQTLLGVETAMLDTWLRTQITSAESQANSRPVRETVEKMIAATEPTLGDAASPVTALSTLHVQLGRDLGPGMSSQDFAGYFVTNRQMKVLSASHPELIGRNVPEFEAFLARALEGTASVSVPFPSVVLMKDETGRMRTGMPTMFVAVPVRDNGFQVVGTLALQMRPEREFTRILQLGRIGASGETYAFDKQGLMVSNSRFDEDLMLLGLLPDVTGARSLLNLTLRNPGGNMLAGFRPKVRRAELPLTKMALKATAGESGVDVDGYADYRGVPVVGAWAWLPKYELGIVTEVDYAEAFRPLNIVQWMFTGIYVLLGISSVCLLAISIRRKLLSKMRGVLGCHLITLPAQWLKSVGLRREVDRGESLPDRSLFRAASATMRSLMQSKATTVEQYLAELPEDRRAAISAVRQLILKSLDQDYEEGMQYGMIGYYVPHRLYPAGYHTDPKQPLPFACLASQKNYMSLYMMTVYGEGCRGNAVPRRLGQDRQEARHGQVLHSVQEARRLGSRRDRRHAAARSREEVDRVLRGRRQDFALEDRQAIGQAGDEAGREEIRCKKGNQVRVEVIFEWVSRQSRRC